jgi:hypothetical protein
MSFDELSAFCKSLGNELIWTSKPYTVTKFLNGSFINHMLSKKFIVET